MTTPTTMEFRAKRNATKTPLQQPVTLVADSPMDPAIRYFRRVPGFYAQTDSKGKRLGRYIGGISRLTGAIISIKQKVDPEDDSVE